MIQKLFAVLLALGMTLLCSARVSAQEIITLPTEGGLYRIDPGALAKLGDYTAAAITMLPAPGLAVLYLDGRPLTTYKTLTPAEIQRILVFSSSDTVSINLGISPFYRESAAKNKQLKIRCINPQY